MAKRVKIVEGKKICSVCKENLIIENFRENKSLTCGLHSQCRKCELQGRTKYRKTFIREGITVQKAENLKGRFYLEVDTYLDMLKTQDNKCAICSENKKLCVDHDHLTGKVRGLLCDSCNKGLGFLRDDEEILEKAKEYIIKSK